MRIRTKLFASALVVALLGIAIRCLAATACCVASVRTIRWKFGGDILLD